MSENPEKTAAILFSIKTFLIWSLVFLIISETGFHDEGRLLGGLLILGAWGLVIAIYVNVETELLGSPWAWMAVFWLFLGLPVVSLFWAILTG